MVLSDGSANIALDGSAGRAEAGNDAKRIARQGASLGLQSLFIDIARRPRPAAKELAGTLDAHYYPLPRADGAQMSALVSGYLRSA